MKILSAQAIRDLDAYTIAHEPIDSIDLMERASKTFVQHFKSQFGLEKSVSVFCGPGNNGGDGYAIARLLHHDGYHVITYHLEAGKPKSRDCQTNYDQLQRISSSHMEDVNEQTSFPILETDIVIDAIFGTGLSRPLSGFWKDIVDHINAQNTLVVSVDVPSGMQLDRPSLGSMVRARFTYTFELPKLPFLFPEYEEFVGQFTVLPIGLHPDGQADALSDYHYITSAESQQIYRYKPRFSHKGSNGKALLFGGSMGMAGALVLMAKGCMRSGAGTTTVHIPKNIYDIVQSTVPEAITSIDEDEDHISGFYSSQIYQAVGIGCGIGQNEKTAAWLSEILASLDVPMVLDADALNIIAEHKIPIPKGAILTPHKKEYERLFGEFDDSFKILEDQIRQSIDLQITIIYKGANTRISTPDGKVYFNSSGNPGMATGGSGDVLCGILTGLLAQGYSTTDAGVLGVYLHGLAADMAIRGGQSHESLIATDISDHLGPAFKHISTV